MARRLQGMVVAITGASAGIGLELALQLHEHDVKLALCARRLDRLEAANEDMDLRHLVMKADVAQPEDCERFVNETVAKYGRLDTLVCNAGYGVYQRVEETKADELQQMMQVDVAGTTECIRHAVPHLMKNKINGGWRGQIMVVSSAAARRGTPFIGAYSGAKAAQLAIAEALRVELSDARIAVTTVHPTPTKTEFRDVAEELGKYKLPPSEGFIKTQTATQVAKAMIKGIKRPRPEIWPWPLARWALGLGTLAPGLMGRLMYKYYDGVLRHNGLR